MKENKELAFPHIDRDWNGQLIDFSNGLTKRDYFAGQIVSALLSNATMPYAKQDCVTLGIELADRLIKELEDE